MLLLLDQRVPSGSMFIDVQPYIGAVVTSNALRVLLLTKWEVNATFTYAQPSSLPCGQVETPTDRLQAAY